MDRVRITLINLPSIAPLIAQTKTCCHYENNKQLYTFRAIINRINSRYTKKTTTNQNLTNPNPILIRVKA